MEVGGEGEVETYEAWENDLGENGCVLLGWNGYGGAVDAFGGFGKDFVFPIFVFGLEKVASFFATAIPYTAFYYFFVHADSALSPI